jgi:HIV-1 Vpr-binding protein
VVEDSSKPAVEGPNGMTICHSNRNCFTTSDAIDREILRTYATGLLAVALGGGDVVEDVLTTGMVAQLMHYLRVRVLGESGPDGTMENKSGGASGCRGRDDVRGRVRPPIEASRTLETWAPESFTEDQETDSISDRKFDTKGKHKDAEEGHQEENEIVEDNGGPEAAEVSLCTDEVDEDADEWVNEDKRRRKERRDGKNRPADWFCNNRPFRDNEPEEAGRAEPSRRRSDIRERGGGKVRGKGRASDGVVEPEKGQAPSSTIMHGGTCYVDGIRTRKSLLDKSSARLEIGLEGQSDMRVKDDGGLDKETVLVGSTDISVVMQRAKSAAQAEARAANAPLEAVTAAGDAAADLVKVAALEALEASNDEEVILLAANTAAATVVDAAVATSLNRVQFKDSKVVVEDASEVLKSAAKDGHECELEEKGDCIMDIEAIATLREQYCVQCLEKMGEYLEVLGPVLHERGVDVCLALLQRLSRDSSSPKDMAMLSDVLKLICALAAHRKFAALLVDRGGVQQLLNTPRVPQTLTGISLCLFAFASLQGVMERVCTLPPSVVQEIVAVALFLLGCAQDPARRNAALFFGGSFVFRAILDAFDSQDGLRKVLMLLRNAAALRSGGGSGTSSAVAASAGSRSDRSLAAEVLTSSGKQIAYHTCVALRQYFRAHLLLLVDSLRPYRGHRGGSRSGISGRAIYKPLDLSNEAMETIILQLQRDRKLGPAFVRARWAPLEKFMSYGGHTILIELAQV